jgi:O-antigen ligase
MLRMLLLAVPIVFMPNALHLSFETGIPGINVANLLFLVVLAVIVLSGRKELAPARGGELTPALLAYFAMLTVGFFIAQFTMPIDWLDDVTSLKNYLFYPLLYFVYRRCRLDAVNTRRLIILVMIVAAVAGLEAVREGLEYGYGRYAETRRAAGPFGVDYRNANRAGVFYAMFLPMFIAMALFFRKQKFWRIAAIAGTAILTLAILATYSRQSYAIGLLGLSLLLIRRNVLLAAMIALLALPAASLLPQSVTQRVAETEQRNEAGVEELDMSTASRFEIWDGAMRMWQDHPLGVGLRRFPQYIGRYSRFAGFDAHNYYVLTLAELGPLGLGALLWLLWRTLRLANRVRRTAGPLNPEAKALGIGFTVTIIAMAMGNLYGSPFAEGSVMANFWILCGLMEHYTAQLRRRADASTADAPAPDPLRAIGSRFPLAARMAPGRYRAAEERSEPLP